MQESAKPPGEHCVVVIGVGLIGGSVAASVKKRLPGCRVIGVGRNANRLRLACEAGLLDDHATELNRDSFPSGSLAVICLPVNQIAETVRQLTSVSGPESVITDAGSVKSLIYQELDGNADALSLYVGSHPIAGSEQTGWESASANLFQNRMCVVTPEASPDTSVARVAAFWEQLGCRVQRMSAQEHDRMLALTSHLPHLIATATTLCVEAGQLPFAGSGFRDTTRVAAGSPDVWVPILCGNSEFVSLAIREAESVLASLRRAVESRDATTLQSLLTTAATLRQSLIKADNP